MLLSSNIAAVEFAGDEVRVAHVKAGGSSPVVLGLYTNRAFYEDPDDAYDAKVKALDEALDACGNNIACYVLCLSSSQTIVRNLTIPFRGARKVAASVRFELEPYLALPIEELSVDYSTVGEFDGETEVLAIAARRDQIAEAQAIFEAVGARVDAITVDAVSMTGLWASGQAMKGVQAVLHLRDQHACLAVTHNKRLAFFRNLPFNTEAIEANPEAFAREVANTLRAFAAKWRGEEEVELLHVTGTKLMPDDAAALQDAIGIPLESGVVIDTIKGAPEALQENPGAQRYNQWEAAIGAAHGASGRGFGVNLAAEGQDINPIIRDANRHVVFSCVLLLLVLGGWALYYYQAAGQYAAESAEIRKQVEALQMQAMDLLDDGLPPEAETQVYTDPTVLEILKILGANLPKDQVDLSEITMAPPGSRAPWITVKGKVGNSAQLQQIYAKLREVPQFGFEVQPDVSVQGNETFFTLKIERPNEVD